MFDKVIKKTITWNKLQNCSWNKLLPCKIKNRPHHISNFRQPISLNIRCNFSVYYTILMESNTDREQFKQINIIPKGFKCIFTHASRETSSALAL